MTFNTELMVRVLAQIELSKAEAKERGGEAQYDPGTGDQVVGWNQRWWGKIATSELPEDYEQLELIWDDKTMMPMGYGTCNTAFCAAGWALTLEKVPMRWSNHGGSYLTAESTMDGSSISAKACELLGIARPGQAGHISELWKEGSGFPRMFDENNRVSDLYAYASHYSEESVERLREMVGAEVERVKANRLTFMEDPVIAAGFLTRLKRVFSHG